MVTELTRPKAHKITNMTAIVQSIFLYLQVQCDEKFILIIVLEPAPPVGALAHILRDDPGAAASHGSTMIVSVRTLNGPT